MPILLWLLLLSSAFAQRQDALPNREVLAIRQTIQAQLLAFQKDDAEEAFSYASPGIKAQFGNSSRFIEMVKNSYAAVYRPKDTEFRTLVVRQGVPIQTVYIEGQDGSRVLVYYQMEKQADGSWRISGVWLENLQRSPGQVG